MLLRFTSLKDQLHDLRSVWLQVEPQFVEIMTPPLPGDGWFFTTASDLTAFLLRFTTLKDRLENLHGRWLQMHPQREDETHT